MNKTRLRRRRPLPYCLVLLLVPLCVAACRSVSVPPDYNYTRTGGLSSGAPFPPPRTTRAAEKVRHFLQNESRTDYVPLDALTEDVFVPVGTSLPQLARSADDDAALSGYRAVRLALVEESSGFVVVNVYYDRVAAPRRDAAGVPPGRRGAVAMREVPAGLFMRVAAGREYAVQVGGFMMAAGEVTQALYADVMGGNPSYFQGEVRGLESAARQGSRPVECVSWFEAVAFCNRLSLREGLEPVYAVGGSADPDDWGEPPLGAGSPALAVWNAVEADFASGGYRLPTEAEWEYAARGGADGGPGEAAPRFAGGGSLASLAWYAENSGSRTHEGFLKAPNALGLYDMSGNVCEWCWDWFAAYPEADQSAPAGPQSGTARVLRGGCYYTAADAVQASCAVDSRNANTPFVRTSGYGFRVCRTALPPAAGGQ